MTVALVRYDAARKAIAAAHRVDEVKQIRDKAEAVRVYAKQAGDFELQNKAAEIRLFAERRAGQLLTDMAKNPGTRGEGRPRNDGSSKTRRSSATTTYPPKLDDIGVTKDQSSKWQRLAKMIDDPTFERALVRAKEKNGELTTAALLREIKDIVTPAEVLTEPDINVIASELIRDIESTGRRGKLDTVVRLRDRLNPSIRKKLILALKNLATDAADSEAQLSKEFRDFPTNGRAFQRVIRERMADESDPLLKEKTALAADFKNATVREISHEQARNVILANEWLGNMGTTEFSFGLYFGEHLAGVACFGRTAGTQVAGSICGDEHAHRVISLVRGACVHWADPPRISSDGRKHGGAAASFLINRACELMVKLGFNIFVAYSHVQSGEIGTVYQASGWIYCGTSNPTEKYRTPDGKTHDARQIHCLTRDRTGGMLRYKRTRAKQKELLKEQGCEFFKDGGRKHRYVGIYGDRRIKRLLRRALRWEVMPYPKRQEDSGVTPVEVPSGFDPSIPSLQPEGNGQKSGAHVVRCASSL